MFFKEGIELLYEVFEKTKVTADCYYSATNTEAANGSANVETFSLAKEVKILRLTQAGLDDAASRTLNNAKIKVRTCL